MKPFSDNHSVIKRTDSFKSCSSVLMWISGFSGASYGEEIPVKSVPRDQPGSQLGNCRELTFDFTSARLLVQTFRIASLHDVQRGVNVHLNERKVGGLVQLAGNVAIGPEG